VRLASLAFAVADATTVKDPSFLADVGEIWTRPAFQVITEFLERLRQAGTLEPDDEAAIPAALGRLEGLKSYPLVARGECAHNAVARGECAQCSSEPCECT